jgi:tetratricopeptide (TPR) repeat protein
MISSDEQKVLSSFAERIPRDDPGAHNNLAIVYYNKGLYQEAIEELEKALELNPHFVLARNNLDIILTKTGKLEERIERLSEDMEKDPSDETKILELADLYVKQKKYSHGIIYYKKILDANPESYEAHFGFSNALKHLGKYDDALEEMNLALKIRRSHEGYRALGEIYLRKGVIDMAIKNLEEALTFDEYSAETHFLLGFALGEKGRTQESIEAVKKAIALNPSLAQGDTGAPFDIEGYGDQVASFKKQLGIPKTSGDLHQIHYNMGMSYRNKGLFDEAEREFRECLKLKEDSPEVHYAIAESELFLWKLDEAITHLEQSLQGDFDRLKSYNALGITYIMQGQFGNAVKSFEKALAENAHDPAALNNLAVAQHALGDLGQALVNYEKAVDGGDTEARYNLAMHYLKSNDHGRALALLDYEGVDAYFGRGLTYMEQGDDQKALEAFRKVLELVPHHAGAYYNMGFIATRMGRYEESLSYIRKGMEIEPNYDNVRYHLSLDSAISDFGPYYVPRSQTLTTGAVDTALSPDRTISPDDLLAGAEEHLGRNQTVEALKNIDEALRIDPGLSRAVVLKADIQFHHGDVVEAIRLLEEYQSKHPDVIEVLAALARVLKESGRFEEARPKYQQLAHLEPDNSVWLNEVAELAYSSGEDDEARDFYLRLLERDPENVAANLRLFRIYLNKNDFAEAKGFMDFLADKHPDSYEYNILAGIYWSEKQQYQKAEEHLVKATEIDASKPLPYYHRGLLSVQRGAFDSACENWKKALLLSPPEDLANRIRHCLKLTIELSEILEREI